MALFRCWWGSLCLFLAPSLALSFSLSLVSLIHSYSFTCSFFSFCIFSLPAFRVSLCLCRALHETTINTISHRLFFSFFFRQRLSLSVFLFFLFSVSFTHFLSLSEPPALTRFSLCNSSALGQHRTSVAFRPDVPRWSPKLWRWVGN